MSKHPAEKMWHDLVDGLKEVIIIREEQNAELVAALEEVVVKLRRFDREPHWSAKGARIVANDIADQINVFLAKVQKTNQVKGKDND